MDSEDPVSGTRARLTKMLANRAWSEAIRMSAARLRENPAPTATPLTAAMIGCATRRMRGASGEMSARGL